jgi:hypothetical protein
MHTIDGRKNVTTPSTPRARLCSDAVDFTDTHEAPRWTILIRLGALRRDARFARTTAGVEPTHMPIGGSSACGGRRGRRASRGGLEVLRSGRGRRLAYSTTWSSL